MFFSLLVDDFPTRPPGGILEPIMFDEKTVSSGDPDRKAFALPNGYKGLYRDEQGAVIDVTLAVLRLLCVLWLNCVIEIS